jgi:hypothetical protein
VINKYCSDAYVKDDSKPFVTGVKILLEDPLAVTSLDSYQLNAVRIFKHNGDDIVETASPAKATDSFAVRVNKRVKLVEEVGRKKVLNNNAYFKGLNMVSPTSNICERLFSSAGLVWSDLRKAMLPSTLEMLLFLKVNRKLWNGNTVQNALKGDVANE